MEYDKYLETEHWKQKRQETLDWWGHKCCICAAREKLEVHHNNYDRLGNEELSDLVVLCNKCHSIYFAVTKKGKVDIRQELGSIMKELSKGKAFGISTGLSDLNLLTCGWQPGELYVLAGCPYSGKTILMLNLAMLLCKDNHKVLIMSIEMPTDKLLLRCLSLLGKLPYRVLRQKDSIPDFSWPRLIIAATKIQEFGLSLVDCGGLSIGQIIAQIRYEHKQNEVDIVFIDHLHLIPTIGFGQNNSEAYGNICVALKHLARELCIPLVLLAQLKRTKWSPVISDLYGSGAIENTADNIWLLRQVGKSNYNSIEHVELIVAKNKSLETGTIELDFAGAFMEFRDPDTGKSEESDLMG